MPKSRIVTDKTTHRTCYICLKRKLLSKFTKCSWRKHSYSRMCKPCAYKKHKKYLQEFPLKWKNTRLKFFYGITLDQFDQMTKEQNGVCPICLKIPEVLCVDHSHKSGQVRGLICHKCNMLLGGVDDNPITLARASEYLGYKPVEYEYFKISPSHYIRMCNDYAQNNPSD